MSSLQHAEPRVNADARAPEDFVAVLDHLGVLQFTGDDAESFLQGQLTCDMGHVTPRSSSYGAYCTAKGRMLANFLLWRDEAGFFMALSRDLVPAVQKQISKFVLRSKVKISDATGSIVLVGASGEHAGRSLTAPAAWSVKLKDGRLLLALTAASADALRGLELADPRVWRWLDIRN